MTVIVQLSDPHFGTERPEVLTALQDWLTVEPPDVLVLSGDITQRARRREFDAARAFLASLPPHTLVATPGNHDIPLHNLLARFLAPFAEFSRAFDTLHTPRFYNGSVAITTLNTATPWLHRHGRIRPHALEAELAWLAQLPAHATRVLVAHHPFAVHRLHDYPSQLPDAPAALSRLAAAGVDVVLGGHVHYPFMRCVTQPAETGHALWVMQAGTALSSRVRAGMPNSVNRLLCHPTDKRQAKLEQWDFIGGRFVCVQKARVGRVGGLVVAG